MHPPPYPALKPFERWSGLLAAGIATLAILASLHQLFAGAAADPSASMARADSEAVRPACQTAAASATGCEAAAPPAPRRTARL